MQETGKDRVKQICEELRKGTLEPAIEEAKNIIAEARATGEAIIRESIEKASAEKELADREILKKQEVFKASLQQGARQVIEWLKQEIEGRLLNQNLLALIEGASVDPALISQVIKVLIQAVEQEGLQTDLSAAVSSSINATEVSRLLGKEMLCRLKEGSLLIGPKKGGVELKLHQKHITIDFSDEALLELLLRYVRKDFHRFFFASA